MSNAQTLESMSPELLKVVERAQREPEGRFHSLAHLIDVSALERAYHRMRKDAAVGVDGITKEQYGQALEANLQDLHARMKAKRYRHQPIRRVYIPKEQGAAGSGHRARRAMRSACRAWARPTTSSRPRESRGSQTGRVLGSREASAVGREAAVKQGPKASRTLR